MEENADTREDEDRNWKRYSKYDDYNYDYNYENNWNNSEINEEDITEAFDIFGLSRESTKDQIKTKYRELTLRFHPDKNKSVDATTKMTEINNAYEIIMGAIA
jgi:DnaJ-class molecular chaperone